MAEDQSYNGGEWNKQFCKILHLLGWEKIGDFDMDIKTEDGKDRGVDSLFKFYNPYKESYEGVIVESKRYQTESFQNGSIKKWVEILELKLDKCKNSAEFQELFPEFKDMSLCHGIIGVWCPDDDIKSFNLKFFTDIENTIINPKRNATINRILVFNNNKILELCSLLEIVKDLESRKLKRKFSFFHRSTDNFAATRSNTLLPLEMLGKFILGEFHDEIGVENKVVFYFGELNIASFRLLRSALSQIGYIDKDKPLTIYTYKRDETNFRKIKPNITDIFSDIDEFNLEEMEQYKSIPKFIKNEK